MEMRTSVHPSYKKPTTMKKIILLTLMIAALAAFKISNSRRIHGTVSDSQDNLPIPGASVKVEGTNIGTVTDGKGSYALNVPDGKTKLVFSFIGYHPKTANIGKSDVLDVALDESQNTLNEVVVTGYAAKRKHDVLGAVATVPMDQSLQGQASGIYGSSAPSVRIRGAASMNKSYVPSPRYSNTAHAGDESYAYNAENTFLAAKDNPLSTFSIDVDAASYSNVRRFINNGQLPPPDAVRVEEMINYFKYDLSGPIGNDPVAIHTELSSAPWNPKHRMLRIGLKAKTINMDKLPPSNMVFLLDVSGSMGEPNKLPLVKAAMKMLVEQLRPQDRVAIVVYSGQAGIKLASTSGNKKQAINDAIDGLEAGGSTAGGAGIKLAYRIARENFMKEGNNRIIMCTDGDFNVDDSSDGDMEQLITRERSSHVPITIMGFGMGNLKDSKMEILADKGNGNYAYIDNLTEARKTLVTEYGGTMFMVAKDVKIQVEFNPAKVHSYRLLGYEDRMLAKEDFNNDKKDAGDMGSGHTVTAFYEIVPTGVTDDYSNSVDPLKYQKVNPVPVNPSNEMMTIKFRYKQPTDEKSKMSLVTVEDKPVAFSSTTDDFRFAAAVAEFGMLLHHSDLKQKSNFDQAISIAKAAKRKDDDGYRSEFVRLAESAKSLSKNEQLITKE
jgi:Ca-activated chloride channel family protein